MTLCKLGIPFKYNIYSVRYPHYPKVLITFTEYAQYNTMTMGLFGVFTNNSS